MVQTQIIQLLLRAKPELGQRLGARFLERCPPSSARLECPHEAAAVPAVPSCARLPEEAVPCQVWGFPPGEEAGKRRSQRRALRVGVHVQQDVVVQLSARCLCRKLWRRVCKWFWNTGIRVLFAVTIPTCDNSGCCWCGVCSRAIARGWGVRRRGHAGSVPGLGHGPWPGQGATLR